MQKEINKTIDVPEGISVEIKNKFFTASKDGKQVIKMIPFSRKLQIKQVEKQIKISCKKPSKTESALAGTISAHIKNVFKGLMEGYVYKLEICNVHFPMNVKVDKDTLIIKNFLGEKTDRKAKILVGVEASVKGNIVELKSFDKDLAGQTAANIEKATRVKNRDRRVFQDGIFIIEKEGIPL